MEKNAIRTFIYTVLNCKYKIISSEFPYGSKGIDEIQENALW